MNKEKNQTSKQSSEVVLNLADLDQMKLAVEVNLTKNSAVILSGTCNHKIAQKVYH